MNKDVCAECATFLCSFLKVLDFEQALALVAAFFGYESHAALTSENFYELENIEDAEILIPSIVLMDKRRQQLVGCTNQLPSSIQIAEQLVNFLEEEDVFTGEAWVVESIGNFLMEEYLIENIALDDELSSEIASTNAIFDEAYYTNAIAIESAHDLTVQIKGLYSGTTEDDKPFCGDEIDVSVTVTFDRVAGKTFFASPEIVVGGQLRRDWYDNFEEPETTTQLYVEDFPHAEYDSKELIGSLCEYYAYPIGEPIITMKQWRDQTWSAHVLNYKDGRDEDIKFFMEPYMSLIEHIMLTHDAEYAYVVPVPASIPEEDPDYRRKPKTQKGESRDDRNEIFCKLLHDNHDQLIYAPILKRVVKKPKKARWPAKQHAESMKIRAAKTIDVEDGSLIVLVDDVTTQGGTISGAKLLLSTKFKSEQIIMLPIAKTCFAENFRPLA